MKYKKELIFISLIICLFSIASVCASDVNETVGASENQGDELIEIENQKDVLSSNENETIMVSENQNDELKSNYINEESNIGVTEENELTATTGTFTDLANDIANAGDEFTLSKNYRYSNYYDSKYKEGIVIDKKITINGNGFEISGSYYDVRAFKILSDNVTLKKINFKLLGYSEDGGVIYWSGANGVLDNCNFNSCELFVSPYFYPSNSHSYSSTSVSYNGGAIYWSGANGVLSNCIFKKCVSSVSSRISFSDTSSNSRGSYYVSSCGGAVYWRGDAGVLSNCSFEKCYSSTSCSNYKGSSYYTWTIRSSSYGGAVYWCGRYGILDNSSFIDCYASSDYNSNDYAYSTSFIMEASGGAVSWEGEPGTSIGLYGDYGFLNNCSFINCFTEALSSKSASSSKSFYSQGGAVYWNAIYGNLSKCSFTSCHSSITSDSSKLTMSCGGAVYWCGNIGVLNNCSYINCSSSEYSKGSSSEYSRGGAIYVSGIYLLSNCIFTNCFTYSYCSISYGGAVYWDTAACVLNNCSFVNCYSECYFFGNHYSYSKGGAVYWGRNEGVLSNCSFINCSVFSSSSSSPTTNSTISYGGAVYWSGDAGVLSNCSFKNCSSLGSPFGCSGSRGGAIYWERSNGILGNCSFINCYSSCYLNSYGGAVYLEGYGSQLYNSNFTNCFLYSNSSSHGGAIYLKSSNDVLDGCNFVNCSSSSYCYDTIYWVGNNGILNKCTFNNKTYNYDAFIYTKYKFNSRFVLEINCTENNIKINLSTHSDVRLNSTLSFYKLVNNEKLLYKNFIIDLNSSFYNIDLFNETAGEYLLNYSFFGGIVYTSYYNFVYFNISGRNLSSTIINITEDNIVAGDTLYINLTLDDDAKGNVSLKINNKYYSKELINGKTSFIISKITAGNNTIDITYMGSDKYYPFHYLKNIHVEFKKSNMNIDVENSTFNNIILNPIVANDATGNISIYLDDIFVKNISCGDKLIFNNMNAGNHNFNLIYWGDEYYAPCSDSINFNFINSFIDLTIQNVSYGEYIILSPIVPSNASGLISIYVDDYYIGNINVGESYKLDNLTGGLHNVTVIYNGDDSYASSFSIVNFEVYKLDSTIDVKVNSIIANDSAIINVTFDNDATGNVVVKLFDKYYYRNLTDGKTIIIIPNMVGGTHNYLINYSGDSKYNSLSKEYSFNVMFRNSSITLNEKYEIFYGEILTLKPVVNQFASGKISIYVDGYYKAIIDVGKPYDLTGLGAGNHTIKVIYSGDNYFAPCENTTTLKVNKINTTISVSPTKVIAGNTVLNIVLNNKATGNITVNVNNKKYNETLSNGKSSVYIYDLPAGNYEYAIDYNGDQNFNQASYKNDLNILSKESNITISSNNIYVDEIAKINYALTSGATGLLSVYVNNEFVKNVSVGNNIELENLLYGNYTVKVIYNSDGYYATCQNTTTFKVQKLNPTFSFTKNNAIAGDEFVITYILNNDATGTITCNNSSKQLINGGVNFNINNIKGGLHQFNISYSGDDKYNPMNKTVNVNIKFKDAIVDFDVKDIIWSDSLTIAPTLTAGATGYLNIYIDNNLNSTININGKRDFTFYVGGYHYIKVSYSGDEYYASNSTTKGFNVIKLNSTCDIKGNIEVDNSATVYVTLNEDATGKVNIYIKGTKYTSNLIEGVATFRVPSLAAGTYSVTIDYEGDTKYTSIYTTKSLEVTLKPSTITLNVKNILIGNNLVIKPIVTSSASGNLKIYVDNVLKKTIAIGSSYTIENPTIGSHNVRVVYAGDSYHQGNETKTTFRVFTFYPIEVQNSAIIYGTDKHFQAIFYDEFGNVAANKLVAFNLNGEDTVVMTDSNGLAVFNKDLPIGTYTVTVINAYVNEKHDYQLKVFTSIESEDMTRAYNTGMDFKVKLLDENGDTLSKGYALFKLNNKDYPVVADNNGIAILNANLPVGTYTVTTTNGRTGETKNNNITIVPSVNANNMVRGYNSGIDFKAQFLDADAKPLINQKVAFIVDNVEYEVTTDSNGYGVLNEQLDVGDYEVTIVNKVTGERAVKNLTVVGRIVENNDVIRIYGEESYYTIRVVGDDGNIVGANEIVNININNIDYQIRTNNNGYASFRIDENIGSYDIFAEYKGYGVYNKVYVLQKLNYISKLDVANVDYKQNVLINMLLSSFNSNAFVEFEVVGDTGYYETFNQVASSSMTLPISGLNASKYTVTAKYYDLNNYKFSTSSKSFNVNKINPKIIVVVENANVGENAKITINIPDVSGNVVTKVGDNLIYEDHLVKDGVIIKEINSLPAGVYNVDVTYNGDNNYNMFAQSTSLAIIQPKVLTNIISSGVTITYGKQTYLVATLKDQYGHIMSGKGLSVFLNGLNTILSTDNNGQVKVLIKGLAPKTYTATITFAGDNNYVKSVVSPKVTVTKATPKLTAKAKSFKLSDKTKKYAVKLNVNQKVKVVIKVNKRTYYAYTTTKGVATFKLNKLTKKGKHTATVSFAGNKCYNKAKSVNVKITVK